MVTMKGGRSSAKKPAAKKSEKPATKATAKPATATPPAQDPVKKDPPAAAAETAAAPETAEKKGGLPPISVEDQQLIDQAAGLQTLAVNNNVIAIAPGVDLMPSLKIAASLVPFKRRVQQLVEMAGRAVIDSADSYARGLQFLHMSKQTFDQIETYRKSVKGPIDDYSRYIQSLFKPLLDQLGNTKDFDPKVSAARIVATKMLAYQQAEQRKADEKAEADRKKREEEAAALAEQERAKGNEAGAAAIEEAVAAAPAPVAQSSVANIRVGGVSATTPKRWEGKVGPKPMVILQAIIDGKVPMSVLDWSQSGLNAYARSIAVKGEHNGIIVDQVESLGIRG